MGSVLFEAYRQEMVGLPLSSIWQGHGSAIFLELGQLHPLRRRDGADGRLVGDFTVMMEWSWRIEDRSSILGGSWSDEAQWTSLFGSLLGRTVQDVTLFGRLPELSVTLSDDRYVLSFMTADSQPAWSLFKRSEAPVPYISVADGEVLAQL
ncbi:hypothetical protein ASF70_08265 [Rhizobium sp. Leaf321]|nr:hypothetical protein ASF70_08265 [Rhizobium sp. Leaf321]